MFWRHHDAEAMRYCRPAHPDRSPRPDRTAVWNWVSGHVRRRCHRLFAVERLAPPPAAAPFFDQHVGDLDADLLDRVGAILPVMTRRACRSSRHVERRQVASQDLASATRSGWRSCSLISPVVKCPSVPTDLGEGDGILTHGWHRCGSPHADRPEFRVAHHHRVLVPHLRSVKRRVLDE